MGVAVTFILVLAILGAVLYALFELSPFAHHRDRFHEPGERQQSPRLD
jgi:hypothetical protein